MGLFSPKWMTENKKKIDKAIAAVAQISEQEQLVQVVREEPLHDVKLEALNRIADQKTLMRFADDLGYSNSLYVYHAARNRLDDEHRKEFILSTHDADQAAEAIVDGGCDDTFLRDEVVLGARSLPCLADCWDGSNASSTAVYKVLTAALANIHDEGFLFDVVMARIAGPLDGHYTKNGWDIKLFEIAVWNITNEELLYDIVCNGPAGGKASAAAISQLHDEVKLQAIVDSYISRHGHLDHMSDGWIAREQLRHKGNVSFYERIKPGSWEPRTTGPKTDVSLRKPTLGYMGIIASRQQRKQ